MNPTTLPYYKSYWFVVERIFNNWTALRLAVEHGMGGTNSKQTALEMLDYITDYCCCHSNIDVYDIQDLLDDIMDEKFRTICEDESTLEVAHLLVRYLQLCKENMVDQMLIEAEQELKKTQCKLWLCQPVAENPLPFPPNTVICDINEACVDSSDDEPTDSNQPEDEPMDEDVDPGWTVVRTKKK